MADEIMRVDLQKANQIGAMLGSYLYDNDVEEVRFTAETFNRLLNNTKLALQLDYDHTLDEYTIYLVER